MTGKVQAQVVLLLAHLVEERTGLHYPPGERELFAQRAVTRAEEDGFESLLDYYYALRYDDPSSERTNALVDALIVGETYFFRELPGLERVVDHVAKRAEAGLSSRIWSAACATGEEPLSLAVLLSRAGLLGRAEIVATDISQRQIHRAQRGQHTRRSLRAYPQGMPPWLRTDNGSAVVDPLIRKHVAWRVSNLADPAQVRALGTFDIILCRNVLIYFQDATIGRTAALLAGALAPDGILLIGASESLLRLGTLLDCSEHKGTFLYRRASA